jgi:Asp-tRNA(Asn)/Glu-tRNA(Gln) amidotransferase A subunit family amidase
VPFDLTGSPALSVPFGWSRDGLPIGVQVVGRHFAEAAVLQVGMALEHMHDATTRHPSV